MREGWTYKKLGEVCENFDSSRKPVTKSDRINGIYPYYGASGVQDYVDKYIFDGRYLLIGEDGAKWGAGDRSAYIIEGKSWVNNHVHIIKLKEGIKDTLIEYYLTYKDLNQYITGAIVPKLTQKNLNNILIPVPPLSEQQAIVSELDKINELISLKKAQLCDLDNLAQSIFYEMFGDPVENEKGWEVKKLEEVCSKITDGTHNSPTNTDTGDYMYVTAKNIKKDGISLDNITYVSSEIHKSIYDRCNPEFGDILYIKDGVTTGVATINTIKCEFSLLSSVALMKLKKCIKNQFLKAVLNMPSQYKYIRGNMGGAAITRLTITKINSIKVPLPPLSLQQSFAARIEAIEKQKEQISATIKDLETLLASRMQYWFE